MTAIDQRSAAAPVDRLTVVERIHKGVIDDWAPTAFGADAALATAAMLATLAFATGSQVLEMAIRASLPLLWPLAVGAHGGYVARVGESTGAELGRLIQAGARLSVVAAVIAYWSGSALSLHYATVTVPLLVLFSVVVRLALRSRLSRLRREGVGVRRLVAVGGKAEVTGLVDRLSAVSCSHGLLVVGACLPVPGQVDQLLQKGIPTTGGMSPEAIARTVGLCRANAVVLSSTAGLDAEGLRDLIWRLEPSGTSVMVAPGIGDIAPGRLSVQVADGVGLVHVRHRAADGVQVRVKDIADRAFGIVALLVLSPVLLGLAAAVRATSRGPVLFRQVRAGKNGRHFTMVKFRTMVVDAERQRSALQESNEFDGLLFKMHEDPRVTRFGRLLRRYSLDELPQLINVVCGTMSLVGPRPHPLCEAAAYPQIAQRRLLVKPGLTGLWQVSGRSDLSWEESLRLDLHYVDNWSLGLDGLVLGRTGRAVIKGTGAY